MTGPCVFLLSPPSFGSDGDSNPFFLVDVRGRLLTTLAGGSGPTSSTGTVTSVTANTASVTLLAANSSRKGAVIFNNSQDVLFAKCGATASSSSFTAKLFPGDTWEVPFGYTGIIDGIWLAASGTAVITEFT